MTVGPLAMAEALGVPRSWMVREDWDEDQHPRDDHGRFGSGGNGGGGGEVHTHPVEIGGGGAKAVVVDDNPVGYVQPITTGPLDGSKFLAHHFPTGGRSGHATEAEAVAAVAAMHQEHVQSGKPDRFQPPAGFMTSARPETVAAQATQSKIDARSKGHGK